MTVYKVCDCKHPLAYCQNCGGRVILKKMRKNTTLIFSIFIAALLMFIAVSVGSGKQETCPDSGGWIKIDSDDISLYPVGGATEYCIKYSTTVDYVDELDCELNDEQELLCNGAEYGLSHWSYKLEEKPTTTPSPTPQNTVTPTPRATLTPFPTITSTPTPTVTPTNTPTPSLTPSPTNTPNPTNTPIRSPEPTVYLPECQPGTCGYK